MKFSFIMVSYNEVEYLEQAIKSCLNQKLDDFEIVIGDDGSNDGSIDLIKKYVEMYPEIIRYSISDRTDIVEVKDIIPSFRVSNVIKRSLDMARGEYCVVLSGDDYFYETGFFNNAICFLDENPDYVAYVGGYEKVWEDRLPIVDYISYPQKIYWARKYIHLSAFVFRKSVYDEEGFLQRFCDDTGLQYSLAHSGKWKYERTIMFAYRQRSGSIMHTANPLQNYIIEVMIFQDILCKGCLYRQSLAKYGKALRYVFGHREELQEEMYQKYLLSCQKYENNILGEIYKYDSLCKSEKLKFKICLLEAYVLETYYKIIGRILNFKSKLENG